MNVKKKMQLTAGRHDLRFEHRRDPASQTIFESYSLHKPNDLTSFIEGLSPRRRAA